MVGRVLCKCCHRRLGLLARRGRRSWYARARLVDYIACSVKCQPNDDDDVFGKIGWMATRASEYIGRELTRIEERQLLDGEVGVPLPATTGSIDRSSTNHWAGPDDRRMMMESNRIDRSCGDDGRATSCFTDSPDAHLLLLAGRCCYCARFSSVAGLAGDREEKDACVAFA